MKRQEQCSGIGKTWDRVSKRQIGTSSATKTTYGNGCSVPGGPVPRWLATGILATLLGCNVAGLGGENANDTGSQHNRLGSNGSNRNDNNESPNSDFEPTDLAPYPVVTLDASEERREWSFLVFLNADNNLEGFGYDDVEEMAASGGGDENVNIIVLFDSYSRNGGRSRILNITDEGIVEVDDGGEVVVSGHEADLGDYRTLGRFGTWATRYFPAQKYALIMWDHGDGWSATDANGSGIFRGFSNDENGTHAGISISNGDYARALEQITGALGRRLDLVGFDACLMGTWEIAAASSPYALNLVASSELEPGQGWPYTPFLSQLLDTPAMTAVELGSAIVDAFIATPFGNSTLAVTDLDRVAGLSSSLDTFAQVAMDTDDATKEAIVAAAQGAWSSWAAEDNRDIVGMFDAIEQNAALPDAVVNAASAVVQSHDAAVLHNGTYNVPGSHGLTVYAKTQVANSRYTDTGAVWSHDNQWDEMLLVLPGPPPPTCDADQYLCEADSQCIPGNWVCDDWIDCSDAADETGC